MNTQVKEAIESRLADATEELELLVQQVSQLDRDASLARTRRDELGAEIKALNEFLESK